MESYEVLKDVFSETGIKFIAKELGLSTSLLYKWTQKPSSDDIDQSGTRNPLDRVLELCRLCNNEKLVSWICQQTNGYYVKNADKKDISRIENSVFSSTQLMIKEFSDMLAEISFALADNKGIDLNEAKQIRKEWETLKSQGEQFVASCEDNIFNKEDSAN
ncbi:MAG: hypothetical protein COA79_24325 [Planctomycetota bacterium]|nr:MAG: hypothetical protein COA79_24325 [Planctomycetota bacterium]